ncbi:CpaD family pilus assembly protein [Altererythrobacter sp. CAU 1778]
MNTLSKRHLGAIAAVSLGLALAACGGADAPNRTLYSVKQPVVEKTNYTLDVQSGMGGLSVPEQRRLADWFDSLDLGYGDRVYVDDANVNPATRDAIAQIAGRHGLLLSEGAPVTGGYVDPGMSRVIVARSKAYVPGCPDWSDTYAGNYSNATTSDYGCAVNGNMAAMIADPEHLLKGAQGTGETTVMSSSKAIDSYRNQAPTGEGGLKASSTSAGGGN